MKKILIPTTYFYPAIKAGGPTVSLSEMVNSLNDKFNFFIITTNKDIDGTIFNINANEICEKFKSEIFYNNSLPSIFSLFKILKKNKFDIVYLNSFFSLKETLPIILFSHLFKYKIILSTRGQLMDGAINNSKKKLFYINIFNLLFSNKIYQYHLTSPIELEGLRKYLKSKIDNYRIIQNLKTVDIINKYYISNKKSNSIKIVFFSRIVPKKNLIDAINIVKSTGLEDIIFDIYGTIEDVKYWEYVLSHSSKINLNINYCGVLEKKDITITLNQYHIFLFPTLGENFGHVIIEALQSGIPVLLSDNTPFKNNNLEGAGWSYSLNSLEFFRNKIIEIYKMDKSEFQLIKNNIKSYLLNYIIENNRLKIKYYQLFSNENVK